MSEEKRSCEVNGEQGYFVKYGTKARMTESGDTYPCSIAIVELYSGAVVTVEPSKVTFT